MPRRGAWAIAAVLVLSAPASARAQEIDSYPLDVRVDGRGGLNVGIDGRSDDEFAPGSGLEIKVAGTAPSPSTLSGPLLDAPSHGVQRLTSRFSAGPSLIVTERVSTADGDASVRLEYDLENTTDAPLPINAAEIADVVSPTDGVAIGVHTAGPPEFAGSLDRLGRRVGLEETTPWSRYEVGSPATLRAHFRDGPGLDDSVTTAFMDVGVGAQWDLELAARQTATIVVTWRFDLYETELQVNTTADQDDGACTDAHCSLREAFRYAERNTGIRLPAGTYGVQRQLESDEGLALIGDGARTTVIDGLGETRILEVEDDRLDVYNVRFTRGNGENDDGTRGAFAAAASVGTGRGGAIAVQPGAALNLYDSAVINNRARNGGGGIASEGELTLWNSVVSGNQLTTAGANGGGISAHILDGDQYFALDVRNSTISANSATGAGGGIYATAPVFLRHATIADNHAAAGTGGGFHRLGAESVRAANTVMDGNLPMACGGDPGERSTASNHVDDQSCVISGPGDVQGVDARIGPLADNGGPTDTHALAPDSPAVDTADGHDCLNSDQRGEPRFQGLGCDKGAYELRGDPFEDTGRIDGRPLDIAADGLGRLQLRFNDEVEGAFYERLDDIGNAGMAFLENGVYYPAGGPDVSGPQLGRRTPISGPEASITGRGGRQLTSRYFVGGNLQVEEKVSYADGARAVSLRYAIRNVSDAPVSFRAGQLAMAAEGGVGVSAAGFVGIRDEQGAIVRLREGATPWRAIQAGPAYADADVYASFGGAGLSGQVDDESAQELGAEWAVENLQPGGERVIEVAWELTEATDEITVKLADTNGDACVVSDCSLREALRFAPRGAVIRVPAGTLQLVHGELHSADDHVVRGAGAGQTVIKAAPDSRVLNVATGTLGVSGVRLTGGNFDGDEYGGGGGVFVNSNAWLWMADSRVDHNAAVGDGGGILAFGTLSLARTTLDANEARRGPDGQSFFGGGGGGVLSHYNARTRLVNVTVSGNTAAVSAGGVAVLGQGRLTNVTVADNTAPTAAGLYLLTVDRRRKAFAPLDHFGPDLRGVLVAGNRGGPACEADHTVRSRFTIADDESCAFGGTGDEIVDEAGITALTADGTHALLATSPAIDSIASGGDCPTSDQAGVARPFGGACDAGAAERTTEPPQDTTPPAPPTVGGGSDATTVTLSGQAEPGAVVTVYEGDTVVGTATAGDDGVWTLSFTGVAPGEHTYTAVARDAAGNVSSRSGAFTVAVAMPAQIVPTPTATPAPEELPPPVVARSVNVEPKSGTVRVRVRGSNRFADLEAGQQIPVGSIVDTTKGRVTLTSAAGGGATQTADFYRGIFRIGQTRGARPVTELTLVEKLDCSRKRARTAQRKRKTRKLWGSGTGRFRTRGSYSSATVRGTTWLTQDTCTTTLIRVTDGAVQVRDLVKRKTIVLRKGKRYTARARR